MIRALIKCQWMCSVVTTYVMDTFFNSKVFKALDDFKGLADVIISNRMHEDLSDVAEKLFTGDLYGRD